MPHNGNKNSTYILVGLIVGGIFGFAFNRFADEETRNFVIKYFTAPIGTAFLRALFMIVIPLVFSSLIVGVAGLTTGGELKRLGRRIGSFYIVTTLAAVLVGQLLVTTIQPGSGIDPDYIQRARATLAEQTRSLTNKSSQVGDSLWPGLVDTVIPKNILEEMARSNMLALIFVSVIFGVALLSLPKSKSAPVLTILESVSEATIRIVGWIMKVAPIAVAALVFNAVAVYDFQILGNVAQFFLVVLLGYLIHFFGFFAFFIKIFVRIPLKEFYKRYFPVIATSFGTSSSNATLPTNINILQTRFGVPEKITNFTLPLGATINMNGTALFEVVTALFVAQVFHIDLTFGQQVALVVIVILTAVGVAGVPGGSIPLLMSAMAYVGIPPEGIALVLGIDRLLDMGRTVLNVTGDAIGALYVARLEGVDLMNNLKDEN